MTYMYEFKIFSCFIYVECIALYGIKCKYSITIAPITLKIKQYFNVPRYILLVFSEHHKCPFEMIIVGHVYNV